jgi:hypothetical protein
LVESAFLAGGFTLAIVGADHLHEADAPAITQANLLAILDALHAQGVDTLQLDTELGIIVSSARHAHLAGVTIEYALTPGSRIFLVRAEDRTFVILH